MTFLKNFIKYTFILWIIAAILRLLLLNFSSILNDLHPYDEIIIIYGSPLIISFIFAYRKTKENDEESEYEMEENIAESNNDESDEMSKLKRKNTLLEIENLILKSNRNQKKEVSVWKQVWLLWKWMIVIPVLLSLYWVIIQIELGIW